MASIAQDDVREYYEKVRSDADSTNWVAFTYDGNSIIKAADGEEYEDLREFMSANDDRVYGYVRVYTGDKESRRAKFAFIQYLGNSAKPLAKARCSTDKAQIKKIVKDFAKEFMFDCETPSLDELTLELKKAGGANYDGQAA